MPKKKKSDCPTCDLVGTGDLKSGCNECNISAAVALTHSLCQDTSEDKKKCDILFNDVIKEENPMDVDEYFKKMKKLVPKDYSEAFKEIQKLVK